MKKFIGFHGDLDLFKVDKIPSQLKLSGLTSPLESSGLTKKVQRISTGSYILQKGSTTGHKHTLNSSTDTDFDVFLNKDGTVDGFQLFGSALLSHEEHRTLALEPGIYLIEHEQEEDPRDGLIKEVID